MKEVANTWLGQSGKYVLEVHPFTERTAAATSADRSSLPYPDDYPSVGFDTFQRATLTNGLQLIVAERNAVPTASFQLIFDSGYAADQFGEPGTSSLAMAMLDEGTESRSALEISEELAQLGAAVGAGVEHRHLIGHAQCVDQQTR